VIMRLHEKLREEIERYHSRLFQEGELPSREQLDRYYLTFRERFGPQQLERLDGELLLETLHDHSNRDSLVYWLEFKDDEELPAFFGSIAGGSALKFGIYRRKETRAWMTGSPQNQQELSVGGAIAIARKHRDQLIRGAELLSQLPGGADDAAYRNLQQQMNEVAPDVGDTAWGHKYFTMLHPNKLDNYHVETYQRFHLIKLLEVPPEGAGRYLCAGRYVSIAGALNIPLNHLTAVLNRRDGRPYRYWRIGTTPGDEGSRWPLMRDTGCVAIGWPDLGDLSDVTYDRESKERVRHLLTERYPNTSSVIGRKTGEIFNFVTKISEGDLVLPSQGKQVVGIGRISGGYEYVPDQSVPHWRPVQWLSLEGWELPVTEGLRTTVHEIRKDYRNLVAIERQVLEAPPIERLPTVTRTPRTPLRLTGIPGRIQDVLSRKGQVILYGPPGTGKTYWALRAARDLAAYASFGRAFEDLSDNEREGLLTADGDRPARVQMCTFHPAYGYEDFIEGYRPIVRDGRLVFERRNGIFKRLCDASRGGVRGPFYLVIDEINRGDIPRIFGELLTILEKDKRGQAIRLPLSKETFSVPDDLYVIGTMNTADRSIALLDTALRRRFGFIELMPDPSVLGDAVVGQSVPLGPWLEALNQRLVEYIGRDARNLQVGHAYLLDNGRPVRDFAKFVHILRDDILPLLQEYCYEDYSTLSRILGSRFVDETRQRIRKELFESARRDDLIQALLEPAPDIVASPEVVASEEEQEDLEREALVSDQDDETE
jgi:5-methylcytosine-specific restriction protein B